jgi:hypothetical protein
MTPRHYYSLVLLALWAASFGFIGCTPAFADNEVVFLLRAKGNPYWKSVAAAV